MKKSFIIPGLIFLCFFYSCLLQKSSKQDLYNPRQLSDGFPPIQNVATRMIDFSRDHGNHSRSLTEWWYFNGHLTVPSGKNYSYAFCLFRRFPLLYFAHISFTDENSHVFTFERKFYSHSKVKFDRQKANISYGNEQAIEQTGDSEFRIKAKLKDINLDLLLKLEKSPLLINGNGLSEMEGGKSFYYSLTRLRTSGNVLIHGQSVPVTGNSWMDHQWGNFYVLNRGWDWFSLQMEDSTEYNLFSFRNKQDKTLKQFANVLDEQNRTFSHRQIGISRKARWHNQETSRRYITSWQIILPERKDTFIITARVKNQELFASKMFDYFIPSYWEGSCTVLKRTADGRTVQGVGFAEHFPYRGKNSMEDDKYK